MEQFCLGQVAAWLVLHHGRVLRRYVVPSPLDPGMLYNSTQLLGLNNGSSWADGQLGLVKRFAGIPSAISKASGLQAWWFCLTDAVDISSSASAPACDLRRPDRLSVKSTPGNNDEAESHWSWPGVPFGVINGTRMPPSCRPRLYPVLSGAVTCWARSAMMDIFRPSAQKNNRVDVRPSGPGGVNKRPI